MPPLRFQPPNPFPHQSLPDLGGGERPFVTAWAARPAVFLVGHRDCVTTRMTLPFVDRIHRRRPADAAVIAILQDDPDSARELAQDLDLALPILVEPEPYPVAAELGLRSVPTVFLVGTDGSIRAPRKASAGTTSRRWRSRSAWPVPCSRRPTPGCPRAVLVDCPASPR